MNQTVKAGTVIDMGVRVRRIMGDFHFVQCVLLNVSILYKSIISLQTEKTYLKMGTTLKSPSL